MSYDLYLWHQPGVDLQELREDVETYLEALAPHDSVGAFRRELVTRFPDLKDAVEPWEDSPGAEQRYVVLTLPFDQVTRLSQILPLAARHGLSGWDPQSDEAFGRHLPEPPTPDTPLTIGNAGWTAADRRALLKEWHCSDRALTRALTCLDLTLDDLPGRSLLERALTAGLAWHLSDTSTQPISRDLARQLLADTVTYTQANGWTGFLVLCADGDHAAVLSEREAILGNPVVCRSSLAMFQLADLDEKAHAVHAA